MQVSCINCGQQTLVRSNHRCMHCNYPLEKAADEQAETSPVPEVFRFYENTVPDKQDVAVRAGWLVQHVPGKEAITYELLLGRNVLGRPTVRNDVDIPVEHDPYVSRKHAVIEVTRMDARMLEALLRDDGAESRGQPSTNGTFVNGQSMRLAADATHRLRHGDAIQVGETVLVFRSIYHDQDAIEAATAVIDTDFIQTIPIPGSHNMP